MSKVLARAGQHISELMLDAGALANISSSMTLNVTLPSCPSRGQKRGFWPSSSPSTFGNVADSLGIAWDIVHLLSRSLQQASQDVFFDVTELTLGCDEIQSKSHSDSDAMLHEGSDLVTLQGNILHLERTVVTMQTELSSLHSAQREAQEQTKRMQAAMGAAQLPAEQQELCSAALASLQDQEEAASAKAAAKRREMAEPQLELARYQVMLKHAREAEGAARRKMTRDLLLRSRCSTDLRALRHGAGIVARHSDVLTYLVEFRL